MENIHTDAELSKEKGNQYTRALKTWAMAFFWSLNKQWEAQL